MILTILSLIISLSTVISLLYAFSKFLSKPHDTLEERVLALENSMRESDREKIRLNTRCQEQDDTNEVLIHATLALIEFEIQYCLTEKKPMSKDLEKAKEDLHHYLAKK